MVSGENECRERRQRAAAWLCNRRTLDQTVLGHETQEDASIVVPRMVDVAASQGVHFHGDMRRAAQLIGGELMARHRETHHL